jgi:hypothetical protein
LFFSSSHLKQIETHHHHTLLSATPHKAAAGAGGLLVILTFLFSYFFVFSGELRATGFGRVFKYFRIQGNRGYRA